MRRLRAIDAVVDGARLDVTTPTAARHAGFGLIKPLDIFQQIEITRIEPTHKMMLRANCCAPCCAITFGGL